MEQVKEEATNHGVWFANLGAYNQGRMLGAWVYPLQYDSYEKFAKRIKEVTRDTVDYADEIAVHDYDDFPNMGEFPCHKELYELIHAVNDSHLDNEVLFKYMENNYYDYKSEYIDEAENNYITTCDNFNDYANYGTEQKVPEVGFMFKEDSPIAGNMQVEGDPYIPQKKGVNKNIANYWKKEIKGISQKELEAVQSMYMITDHSGVIQMYKAGKRAFIKSLK